MSTPASKEPGVARLGRPMVARRPLSVVRIPLRLLAWSWASATMSWASMPSATGIGEVASGYLSSEYCGVIRSSPGSAKPSPSSSRLSTCTRGSSAEM